LISFILFSFKVIYFAITWKIGGAPIPGFFVSYPNPKLKRFQKEHTTVNSGLSILNIISGKIVIYTCFILG